MATQEKLAEVREKQTEVLNWTYLHRDGDGSFLCPLWYCERALAFAELRAREAETHARKHAAETAARDVAAGVQPYPASVYDADGRMNGDRDGYRVGCGTRCAS